MKHIIKELMLVTEANIEKELKKVGTVKFLKSDKQYFLTVPRKNMKKLKKLLIKLKLNIVDSDTSADPELYWVSE